MKYHAFNATCPFEIGDKIRTYAANKNMNQFQAGLFNKLAYTVAKDKPDNSINIMGINLSIEVHEITDILCIHALKSGKIIFQYELDHSGKYINIGID